MMFPYRSWDTSSYFLPICRPRILRRLHISGFSVIYLTGASLTFKNLPLNGKTPNVSLPTTSIPARAKLLAESPSVSIIVHLSAVREPASLASSSLGIPSNFYFFLAPPIFKSLAFSRACDIAKMLSTMPESNISFKNFSESSTLLPKLLDLEASVSLVCPSNAGFSIRQFTKTHRFDFI